MRKLGWVVVAGVLFGANGWDAQAQSVGAKYGSRDPRTCKSTREPTRGAISAEQARQYVVCASEKVAGGDIYLLENVKVEVGGSRPFNPASDRLRDVDVKSPIYPIRGSRVQYLCVPVSNILKNEGANCLVTDEPNARGLCYRTTFADWYCHMHDINGTSKHKQPPPK